MKRLLTAAAFLVLAAQAAFSQVSFGESSKFNEEWLFMLGDCPEAAGPAYDDSGWRVLSLPHDWSIEGRLSPDLASCTGYLPGGIGWYRKHFDGRQFADADRLYIYFEGIYNRSSVYLNGHLLGERPNGYISFMYDMTPWLDREGDNVLSVRVDHSREADSRWYTGSGIYRDVWLIKAGNVHFAQWGVGYVAEPAGENLAEISVDAAIEGLGGRKCSLVLSLYDGEKRLVSRTVRAKDSQTVSMKLRNPRLWDIDDPFLYTLKAEIVEDAKVLDRVSVPVGIRTLEFDPDLGFAINGRWTKVKGVCLHHDAGVLGAAVPTEVLERRLKNLKAIGVNAIRTSHNPQAPVFYDLCDRIGLLVMDEAFDEWEFPKRKWVEGWNVGTPAYDGSYDFFGEWGETDVRDMVRRDRNHPCIFMWSIGNEVDYPNDPYSHPVLAGGNEDFTQAAYGGYDPDAPSAMRIGEIGKRLAACVREVDLSRPVTGALAGVVMSNQTEYPEALDVVGYNYTESRYAIDHEKYPERIIYGSENRPDYQAWTAVRDNPFIFGQFIWTGIDYLGESGRWPSRGMYTGLLDFCGFLKPRGWFRTALWSENPVCYIGTSPRMSDSIDAWDDWNYEDGQKVRVVCFTNAESAALFLNGEQVGVRKPVSLESGMVSWDVDYAAGTLRAVGYEDEVPVSEYETYTSLRPLALRVIPDRACFDGEGSVVQLTVEVLDDNGNVCKLADNIVACTVEGPAELLGLESGDNADMGDWTDNSQRTFRGRLLAYIRATGQEGKVTVRFSSPLLEGAETELAIE